MASKFQRRHYEAIAEVVKNLDTFDANFGGDEMIISVEVKDLIKDLCNCFKSDNPKFRADYFEEAASGKFDD